MEEVGVDSGNLTDRRQPVQRAARDDQFPLDSARLEAEPFLPLEGDLTSDAVEH